MNTQDEYRRNDETNTDPIAGVSGGQRYEQR